MDNSSTSSDPLLLGLVMLVGLLDKSLRSMSAAKRESHPENPNSASWEDFRMEPRQPGWDPAPGEVQEKNCHRRSGQALAQAVEPPSLEVSKNVPCGDMVQWEWGDLAQG